MLIQILKDTASNAANGYKWQDESFVIPFTNSKQSSLCIDVFDTTFIGKGAFLGRVEIPFDQLVSPPPSEFDYALKTKQGLAAKKQARVGGMLTLEYDIERKASAEDSGEDGIGGLGARNNSKNKKGGGEAEAGVGDIVIPRSIFNMQTPAVCVCVQSATNLAKANMFGAGNKLHTLTTHKHHTPVVTGKIAHTHSRLHTHSHIQNQIHLGSDPYFLVYLLPPAHKQAAAPPAEWVHKSKVINASLNPFFNDVFVVNLGIVCDAASTKISDFPTIRIEMYSHRWEPSYFTHTIQHTTFN